MRLPYMLGTLRRSLLILIAMCCVVSFVLRVLISDPVLSEGSPWQHRGRRRDAYVIVSAYYDNRPSTGNPSIRILGYSRVAGRPVLHGFCRIQFEDGREACLSTPATVAPFDLTPMHGNSSLASYLCHLHHDQRPIFVILSASPSCSVGSELGGAMVRTPEVAADPGFGLCLSNIAHFQLTNHDTKNDAQSLVEFVEMNTLLGMRVMYMYTYGIHADVMPHVKWYEARGRMSIIDWTAHASALGEREATTLALNDCLYRRMRSHAHLVFSDLNQLVTPNVKNSWRHLLADLSFMHNSSRVGVYVFRTFRYYDERGAPQRRANSTVVTSYRLPRIVTHRVRERRPPERAPGGGYVIDPAAVLAVTSSRALRMLPGRRFYTVPPTLGCVHVYPPTAQLSARELFNAFLDPSLDKFVPSLLKVMHERFFTPRRIHQPA